MKRHDGFSGGYLSHLLSEVCYLPYGMSVRRRSFVYLSLCVSVCLCFFVSVHLRVCFLLLFLVAFHCGSTSHIVVIALLLRVGWQVTSSVKNTSGMYSCAYFSHPKADLSSPDNTVQRER